MRKSKIKSAIRIALFIIIAGFMTLFYVKLKNIEQDLGKESSGLINITPTEKNIDIQAIQDEFLTTIENQKSSTAAVMVKKKIKVVWEEWEEETEIETWDDSQVQETLDNIITNQQIIYSYLQESFANTNQRISNMQDNTQGTA